MARNGHGRAVDAPAAARRSCWSRVETARPAAASSYWRWKASGMGTGRPLAASRWTHSDTASMAAPRSPTTDTRRSAHRRPRPEQKVHRVSSSRNLGDRRTATLVRRTTQATSLSSPASTVSSLDTSCTYRATASNRSRPSRSRSPNRARRVAVKVRPTLGRWEQPIGAELGHPTDPTGPGPRSRVTAARRTSTEIQLTTSGPLVVPWIALT